MVFRFLAKAGFLSCRRLNFSRVDHWMNGKKREGIDYGVFQGNQLTASNRHRRRLFLADSSIGMFYVRKSGAHGKKRSASRPEVNDR